MELLNGKPERVSKGDHIYTVELNGGTAQLEYSTVLGFKLVPGSDSITGDGVVVRLSAGPVQAVITGNARVSLEEA